MAGFVERVVIEVEARTQKAVQGFKDTKQAVAEAEGAAGKLKTAFTGSVDTLVQSIASPAGIAAVVGASVAAGEKLIGTYEDLTLKVGKFSDATGLSTEQASRWVEVMSDLGISTEDAQGAFGKLEKAIGTNGAALEKMGLNIAHAQDGTVDMNQTILNAIGLLHNTEDASKRAELGAALFGKGWQNMAELVGQGSDQVADSLKKVQDSKVFDASAVADARKYREEMDNLHDSLEGIQLTLGHLLVNFEGPALQGLGNLVGLMDKAITKASEVNQSSGGWFGNILKATTDIIPGVGTAVRAYDALNAAGKLSEDQTKKNTAATQDWGRGQEYAAQAAAINAAAQKAAEDALKDQADQLKENQQRWKEDADATKEAQDALEQMDDAILASLDSTIGARRAHEEYTKALKDGKASADDRTEAALKAADADVKSAEEAAKAAGQTFNASDKNRVLIASLSDLAAQATGPTKAALQAVVDQLKAAEAHSDVTFNLNLNNQQFMDALAEAERAAAAAQRKFGGVGTWVLDSTPVAAANQTTIVNVPPTLNPERVLAAMGTGQTRGGGLRRG